MNRNDPINIVANIITIAGWLPIALFVGFYAARSRWRSTLVGRTLMLQSGSLLLTLTVVQVGLWWPDMPFRPWFRLISYGVLVVAMWRMFLVLLSYQRQEVSMQEQADDRMAVEDAQETEDAEESRG
jgi:hypothetical protein